MAERAPRTDGLVSIVLVTYQSADDLPDCLATLPQAAGALDTEVIVVDNASRDGSADLAEAAGATVVRNAGNPGLSTAINQGAELATGEWLFVLNPDTELREKSIQQLVERLASDPAIGAVGPNLVQPDGTRYPTGRRFPSLVTGVLHAVLVGVWPANPATRRYHMDELDRTTAQDVDWVSGAGMMIRRDAFDAIGGFDAKYFMYFEELDFCLRLHRGGWRVVFDPEPTIMHKVGGSTKSAPYRKVINHHRSAVRFFTRRHSRSPLVVLTPLIAVLLAARCAAVLAVVALRRRRGRP